MHTLIVGNSGVNRSAFIDRVLSGLEPKPKLYGYRSVKEAPEPDGRCPIYIYPIEGEKHQSARNLLGWCRDRNPTILPQAFTDNAYLIEYAGNDGLLVMDEIGPMEGQSLPFCTAVMRALDGEMPVLAAVRDNDTAFLRKVRGASKARCFLLTEDNADELYPQVLKYLKEQIKKS